MARRKVVVFIVEGITEKESLELLLQQIVEDSNEVIFRVAHGDITSDINVNSSNIRNKITEIIKSGGKFKYRPSDYKEVIHLVDTDGAFLPDENLHLESNATGFIYKEDGIYFRDIDKIKDRNERKKQMIDMLLKTKRVYGTIPYKVFFFSCNLEHVLHDLIQVDDVDKFSMAEKFIDKYIDDIDGFIDFICNSGFSIKKSYEDSWNFIMESDNSIKRFTNFNLLVEEYI